MTIVAISRSLKMYILSFDIEEWFHILDNDSTKTEKEWNNFESRIHEGVDRILNLLQEKNKRATFFVLGWVAQKYPEVVKKIDSLGYEVATHSHMHQLAYEQTPTEFEDDLKRSIDAIGEAINKQVTTYRAPGFSFKSENRWVFDILAKNKIEVDCSIFPANRAHGGFSQYGVAEPSIIDTGSSRLKEFPINLHKIFSKNLVFSGGGYFRLLPYFMIKSMTKQADYVITYFHPRDFDANQPMIEDLPLIRKFKSYYGIKGAYNKLSQYLDDFDFIDIQTAIKQVNWDSVKIVKV
jgi:polysaccharide deacetylase family protein (PEP-CTERM system associated)